MPIPRAPVVADIQKLEDVAAAFRREADCTETDPFDVALVAGVVSLADRLRAESVDLEALRGRMVRLARQTRR